MPCLHACGRSLAVALALAAGLPGGGCGSTAEKHEAPGWIELTAAELGTMRNVSVSDGLWIGGSPSETDLDLAHRRGIRRLISLCTREESPPYDLREVGRRLGLEVHELGPRDSDLLGDGCVDRTLALLASRPAVKTLVFCEDGSRSAAVFAIHRVVQEGMPLDRALLEARRAGLRQDDIEKVERHVERLGEGPTAPR